MTEVKELEKTAILYLDNSKFAKELQSKVENVGYIVKIVLSGSPSPVFVSDGMFLEGYGDIQEGLLSRFYSD